MTTVEFVDRGGNPVGRVSVTDSGELLADPGLESVVDSWVAKDRPMSEFTEFYDGWSNGYMTARVTRAEGRKSAASLGTGARFKALSKLSADN